MFSEWLRRNRQEETEFAPLTREKPQTPLVPDRDGFHLKYANDGFSAVKIATESRVDAHAEEPALLSDRKGRKTLRRMKAEEKDVALEGWYGLKRRQLTPELEAEIAAVQLRGHMSQAGHARTNRLEPKHFSVAVVSGPGGSSSKGRRRKTILGELLKDKKGVDWLQGKKAEFDAQDSKKFTRKRQKMVR